MENKTIMDEKIIEDVAEEIMDGFNDNPDKEKLQQDLELVNEILNAHFQGNGVEIDKNTGMVILLLDNGKVRSEIGQISNLNTLKDELIGDNEIDGINYVIMEDIGFITYHGNVIGCGTAADFDSNLARDMLSGAKDVMKDIKLPASLFDKLYGKDHYVTILDKNIPLDQYSDVSKLLKYLTTITRLNDSGNGIINVNDRISEFAGKTKIPGKNELLTAYSELMMQAELQTLVELMMVDVVAGYNPILEMDNNYQDVSILWREGEKTESGEGTDSQSRIDIFEKLRNQFQFSDTQMAQVVLEVYGDLLDADTKDFLEEVAAGKLEVSEEKFEEWLEEKLAAAEDQLGSAQKIVSPLVIDLGQEGIATQGMKDGVYFDLDDNGSSEKTGWITADDVFLALDLDGDGRITDGGELFGDHTKLANGSNAKDGFEALAQYDTNQDGKIDRNDEVFDRLVLWNDKNQDGQSTEDELRSLSDVGIGSIGLETTTVNKMDEATGTLLTDTATVIFEDGRETTVGDYWFSTSNYDTTFYSDIEISDEIAGLPDVRGFGNVPSLQIAMAMDESGELAAYVRQFMDGANELERKMALTEILYKITGGDEIAVSARGGYMDARSLHVLEELLGSKYYGVNRGNPGPNATKALQESYKLVFDTYYSLMISETVLKDYMKLVIIEETEQGMNFDTGMFDRYVANQLAAGMNLDSVIFEMGRYISSACGSDSDEYISYKEHYVSVSEEYGYLLDQMSDEIKIGSDSNDLISAGTGNNILSGKDGNDNLFGVAGNDILIGGIGNDSLSGGEGVDTYLFNLGDGKDTINNADSVIANRQKDRILFGEGISAEDIQITRAGDDMILTNLKSGDEIKVRYAYSPSYTDRTIENVDFADGTHWGSAEIAERARVRYGTDANESMSGYGNTTGYNQDEIFYGGAGNDSIYAGTGDDVLYGEAGSDTLSGDGGNDVLSGGIGNDSLSGGEGVDTYLFNLGDGKDTINNADSVIANRQKDRILFGEGISAEDIQITRAGDDMILTNLKSGDEIKVRYAYSPSYTDRTIENVDFADGTHWGSAEIAERARVRYGTDANESMSGYGNTTGYNQDEIFYGGAGNDSIYAGIGDDVLYGEAGSDTLNGDGGNDVLSGGIGADSLSGGEGVDTYLFNLGDGKDIINNADSVIANRQKDRILFGEGISAEDIQITRAGDDMILTNLKSGDEIKVRYAYSPGYTDRTIENVDFADGTHWGSAEIAERARVRYGTDANESMSGYGNTTGYNQDEIFYGGAGNDSIYAGIGDDVLYGEAGSDTLNGDGGNDILSGGIGADSLSGGEGVDTYLFNLGDGKDIINNADSVIANRQKDRILFGEGISAEDIQITRAGDDMILTNLKSGDEIKVRYAYSPGYTDRTLENVDFADGTHWGSAEIAERARVRYGTDANDSISGYENATGYSRDEVLYAGAGNDTIYGGTGNDTLVGGIGNDYLNGDSGADTYLFNVGDGKDTISNYDTVATDRQKDRILFGEGINAEDIRITRSGNHMIITNLKSGDEITVSSAYSSSYSYGYSLENIDFADGTHWGAAEIAERARVRYGTDTNDSMSGYENATSYSRDEVLYAGAGNDTIYGGTGNDTLVGGIGNDYLSGDSGADTYLFNLGDGKDTINNYDTVATDRQKDRILFGEGISAEDIRITRSGNNMIITNLKSGDEITVSNAYHSSYSYAYSLENIDFADGTHWGAAEIAERARVRYGTDANDSMSGYENTIGYSRDEVLYAGAGNDTIYGGTGNDTLVGGIGNDYLNGDSGADTYLFNVGDGKDTINNYDTVATDRQKDRILFGEGINAEDIRITRSGNHMIITNLKNGDEITVSNAYHSSYSYAYSLENIDFADGTHWGAAEIAERARVRYGTDANDSMYGYENATGYSRDEVLYAGAGNDTIYGGTGNDTLVGGIGNDYLNGDSGADTYLFNVGDGKDTINNADNVIADRQKDRILFGEGISAEDIRITRVGDDMILTNLKSGDVITVQYAYSSYYTNRTLENVDFADGTHWGAAEIAERARVRYGTDANDSISGYENATGYSRDEVLYAGAGNDTIYGGTGNDTLVGGIGNDYLSGDSGADTYLFNVGDGKDTINNADSVIADRQKDRILFGEGISAEDIRITRVGDDMILTNLKSGDVITVQYAYSSYYTNRTLENVDFADGTHWGAAEIAERARVRYGTDANDSISGYENATGYSRDEVLYAGAGNDTIYGGTGNDTLVGGIGNDYLNGDSGADTYLFNVGDGKDTINNADNVIADRQKDRILFGEGISAEDIRITRVGDDMILTNLKSGDVITVQYAYSTYYTNRTLENVDFADGTHWGAAEIADRASDRTGTDAADSLTGYAAATAYSQDEEFHTGGGNDTVLAGEGNDTIYGEEGDDSLFGEGGNDLLSGGIGNDLLTGGTGDDLYLFGLGYGIDTITDNAGTNTVQFLEGISAGDLIVTRSGSFDLEISIRDTNDKIILKNYNQSASYQNITFRFEDGVEATIDQSTNSMQWDEPEQPETSEAVQELPEGEAAGLQVSDILLTDTMTTEDTLYMEEMHSTEDGTGSTPSDLHNPVADSSPLGTSNHQDTDTSANTEQGSSLPDGSVPGSSDEALPDLDHTLPGITDPEISLPDLSHPDIFLPGTPGSGLSDTEDSQSEATDSMEGEHPNEGNYSTEEGYPTQGSGETAANDSNNETSANLTTETGNTTGTADTNTDTQKGEGDFPQMLQSQDDLTHTIPTDAGQGTAADPDASPVPSSDYLQDAGRLIEKLYEEEALEAHDNLPVADDSYITHQAQQIVEATASFDRESSSGGDQTTSTAASYDIDLSQLWIA